MSQNSVGNVPTRCRKVSHDPVAIVTLLAAKLRRSKTDASAGAVEEIARIVAWRFRLRPRGADGMDATRRIAR